MLEDARAGKFDLIVTREVCRFARNTVDTLVTTRELKNIGVEVYFVEDNIWTMDGDGELRLTIMATLAQEESRKVSERVKAGQQISRMNGTIYGCGNILGYDRVKDTYVKNPEQAETVRMIFDMYLYEGKGTTAIANELTRRQRLNASGINKWNAGVISRILNNQTYMGVMAYGKSYSNNYLEQKRVNNYDASTYMCVKANFEPIVTEEEWYECQAIKSRRVKTAFKAANEQRKGSGKHGVKENRDLWGSKLKCSCGRSFRKNRWHKNKEKAWSYGYQCYNQLNNGSASQRRKIGADDTGFCDQSMIADWKLELMAKLIFERIWVTRKTDIDAVCRLIKECYQTDKPKKVNVSGIVTQIERYRKKKTNLLDMRTDGEISKEDFADQKGIIEKALSKLNSEYDRIMAETDKPTVVDPRWDEIRTSLNEKIDFSNPQINRDVVKKFVAKIVPNGKTHFRWYMNLDGNESTAMDVVAEGRKNNPVVLFADEEDKPPLHNGDVIGVSELMRIKNNKVIPINTQMSSPVSMQHRLLSRI